MRKALIAAAVATALFAVGAFAASFTVQSEDIASGANAVDKCAAFVDIAFGPLTAPPPGGVDFTVTSATATFRNTAGLSSTCDTFNATLALTVGGVVKPFGPVAVTSSVATFDLRVAGVGEPVGPITNAAVAVEGVFLPTPFTPPT